MVFCKFVPLRSVICPQLQYYDYIFIGALIQSMFCGLGELERTRYKEKKGNLSLVRKWPSKNKGTRDASVGRSNYSITI